MAYDNLFYSIGYVIGKKILRANKETKEKIGAGFTLRAYRTAPNSLENNVGFYDDIFVYTNRETEMDAILSLKENQMVLVSGSFLSRDVPKEYICPECGERTRWVGSMNYIGPLAIKPLEEYSRETYASENLNKYSNLSNQCRVMGAVVKSPKFYEDSKGRTYCSYALGVNRVDREDFQEKKPTRADYFWVRSFDKQSISDYNRLSLDSFVMVKGSLQARSIILSKNCSSCGMAFEHETQVIELVADRVEYLADFVSGNIEQSEYLYPIGEYVEKEEDRDV